MVNVGKYTNSMDPSWDTLKPVQLDLFFSAAPAGFLHHPRPPYICPIGSMGLVYVSLDLPNINIPKAK